MPEQFRVDGALRNGAAVYRDKFVVFPAAEAVDDLGKNFLADTALSRDEHSEVCRRNAGGRFERSIEQV